ncbi:MAG: hypothetical protein FJ279_09520, partial [Planctomycetes bacterium]|nr:hypothetical protein [Planctomycetota bacterium]
MVHDPCSHRPRSRFRPIAEPLLIAALAFLATGASLRNGFVWEDDRLILRSRGLRDAGSAWLFLDPRYWREDHISAGTAYRPVRELSFAADARLWGGWAGGFHLTNVALHAANSVLAYYLAVSLFGAGHVPLAAAALFAVHPLNT